MKKLYILLFTILISTLSFGQTTGDIAFIGFNADGDDDIAIVALADIAANSTIYITDNEVNGLALADTNEGELTWDTGGALITAGTVVVFTDLATGTSSTVTHGSITAGSSLNLSSGGDAIFMYLGTDANTPTTFLAGVQNETGNEGNLTGSGLTDGTTFFTFTTSGNPDGGVYTGLRNNQAAFSDYLNQIAVAVNWDEDPSNGESLLPFDTTPFTLGTPMPTITITAPSDGAVFSPGTTSVDVEFFTSSLAGGETVDIDVNGTVTTGVTSPYAVTTTDGQAYNITVNLMDGASVVDFEGVDFSIGSLTQVADVTTLRADVVANGLGRFYEITGSSLLTHTDGFNDRKWIQDASVSGVLIYDEGGVIAATYAVGDMITGLKGYTTDSNGVLRFIPTSDSGVIASSGNPVVPQTVTISDLNTTPDDYESELIKIANVTFPQGDGTLTFSTGQNFDVFDGALTTIMRTEFYGADYIGEIIPQSTLDLVGVAGEYRGTAQIYVRSLADINTLGVKNLNVSNFSLYPNPTSTGFVTITSNNSDSIQAQVFDTLGKQVLNNTISNNRLNVSSLNAGLYIVKLTQDNTSVTKKLVIK